MGLWRKFATWVQRDEQSGKKIWSALVTLCAVAIVMCGYDVYRADRALAAGQTTIPQTGRSGRHYDMHITTVMNTEAPMLKFATICLIPLLIARWTPLPPKN